MCWIVVKIIKDVFTSLYHILNFIQQTKTKFTMEHPHMLPILHCHYHACWWPGDLRSQGISRHCIDQINQNILSLASEELRLLQRIKPRHHARLWCLHWSPLTHWGRVTHICVSKLTIIGSDNGSSPGRCQAIIWTNAGILLIGPLGTNFSEILIGIYSVSFKKMHLKMSTGKWWPFCVGLNVSNIWVIFLQMFSQNIFYSCSL